MKSRLHPVASNFKQKASRGRVLAEGDVDPAAGSRDEPFKAVGRSPSTKLESQSVCIKLIQGGAASAAGLFHLPHFLDQKIVKKTRGTN